MKKQFFYTTILILPYFLLGSFICQANAGCTKKAAGDLYIHYSYKLKSSNAIVQDKKLIKTYKAEGRYNGGCNTPVGRQKARKRACEKVKKIAKREFEGKFARQKLELCKRGVLTIDLRRDAEWFQIRFLKLYTYVLKDNGSKDSGNKLNGWTTIPAASSDEFRCIASIKDRKLPASSSNSNKAFQPNVDLPGSDYTSMSMRIINNPRECQAACRIDPKCVAWTWVRPGVQGQKPKCWLKDSVPSPQRNTNCVSGIK